MGIAVLLSLLAWSPVGQEGTGRRAKIICKEIATTPLCVDQFEDYYLEARFSSNSDTYINMC